MTAMAMERPIFENRDWLVTEGGLEHKTTGYFIERESLAQRRSDGLWIWPMQMAEKSWCALPLFTEAFSRAASAYRVEADADLARTLQLARHEVAAWPSSAANTNDIPAPRARRTLQSEGRDPILWEPERTLKTLRDQEFRSQGESPRKHALKGARVFPAGGRSHDLQTGGGKATGLPWRTSYHLQKTGTTLVRLLQAAWSTR